MANLIQIFHEFFFLKINFSTGKIYIHLDPIKTPCILKKTFELPEFKFSILPLPRPYLNTMRIVVSIR
jgi:hypothetical protein